jgi:hypothetical protein
MPDTITRRSLIAAGAALAVPAGALPIDAALSDIARQHGPVT